MPAGKAAHAAPAALARVFGAIEAAAELAERFELSPRAAQPGELENTVFKRQSNDAAPSAEIRGPAQDTTPR